MDNGKRLIDAKDFDLRVSQKKMSEVFPNWKELPKEVQDAVCKHGQYFHMLLETQTTVDAVVRPDCEKCAFNEGIAYWHQCEHCIGQATNNFVPKVED